MCRDEGLGHARRVLVAEPVGHCGDVPLVHDDAVGKPTATDDPEDSLPDLEAVHLWAALDHRPAGLDPRDVPGRAGRGRVVPGALGEIGRVETCIADREQDLATCRYRIGALLYGDDLVPSGPREDHGTHRGSTVDG